MGAADFRNLSYPRKCHIIWGNLGDWEHSPKIIWDNVQTSLLGKCL